jgi:hypothetical protein
VIVCGVPFIYLLYGAIAGDQYQECGRQPS